MELNKKIKKIGSTTPVQTIDQELLNIYKNQEGRVEDVSRLEFKKPRSVRTLVGIIAVLILGILSVSFLTVASFERKNGEFSGKSVDIRVISEPNITSGEEITYTIEYTGKDKVKLLNSELIVKYPNGFLFVESDPEPQNSYKNIFSLGNIENNVTKKVTIKGKLIGELGSLKTLDATINYRPENFSSSFKESTSFVSQVTSSILSIEIEGDAITLPEKNISFKIPFQNSSRVDLTNVQVVMHYPDNFEFIKADPLPSIKKENNDTGIQDAVNNVWFIDVLEAEEPGAITLEGKFKQTDNSEDDVRMKAEIGFVNDENEFSLQIDKSFDLKVINHNLKIDFFVNGKSQDDSINFGEPLNYLISYKNLGNHDLKDFSIRAILDSNILDWDSLVDKNLGKVEGNEIVWDTDSIATFSEINPLEEGTIEFSIGLKEENSNLTKDQELEVKSTVISEIGSIGDVLADVVLRTPTIVHSINTAVRLSSQGRYFNDDNIAVGFGPLPPQIGQKTTYRIYWNLSNSIHKVENVSVSTTLAEGVEWEGRSQASAGQLQFNPATKKIEWIIQNIEPYKTFDDLVGWFNVYVTPTQEQLGKVILLITDTTLRAVDETTHSSIAQLERSITSNLEDDPFGGGRGIVEEGP